MKYGMRELPVNMLPIAQLEAILGSALAQMICTNNKDFEYKQIGQYEDLPVLGL
jgi:hypothetical protein